MRNSEAETNCAELEATSICKESKSIATAMDVQDSHRPTSSSCERLAYMVGAKIWEGDEQRKLQFSEAGGSLNGPNLSTDFLTKASIH